MPAGEIRRAGRVPDDGRLDEQRDRDQGGDGKDLEGQRPGVTRSAAPEPKSGAGQRTERDGGGKVNGKKGRGYFARPLPGEDGEEDTCDAESEKPENGCPSTGRPSVEDRAGWRTGRGGAWLHGAGREER